MAEREGFEPSIPLRVCRISSAVLSTTQPPLRRAARRPLGAPAERAAELAYPHGLGKRLARAGAAGDVAAGCAPGAGRKHWRRPGVRRPGRGGRVRHGRRDDFLRGEAGPERGEPGGPAGRELRP